MVKQTEAHRQYLAIKRKHSPLPKPVEIESRICFGIAWFATKDEANRQAAFHQDAGITVNGGWFDGMICGRAPEFDKKGKDGKKLYAVRT
jgi:hypothetical protein